MYLLSLILLLATLSDFSFGKIPRGITLGGFALSQIWALYNGSFYSALISLLVSFGLLVLLYPLFMIGCLGGGDIKLLICLPGFVGARNTSRILWYAFIVSVILGTIKLVVNRQFLYRIRAACIYLLSISKTGKIEKYNHFCISSGGRIAENQIHFSVAVVLGFLVHMLIEYI